MRRRRRRLLGGRGDGRASWRNHLRQRRRHRKLRRRRTHCRKEEGTPQRLPPTAGGGPWRMRTSRRRRRWGSWGAPPGESRVWGEAAGGWLEVRRCRGHPRPRRLQRCGGGRRYWPRRSTAPLPPRRSARDSSMQLPQLARATSDEKGEKSPQERRCEKQFVITRIVYFYSCILEKEEL